MGTPGLELTIYDATRELSVAFVDGDRKTVGSVRMDAAALGTFLGQLLAARGRLQTGPTPPSAKTSGAMTELPPPLWYKSMTAGADAKTGGMILGFELGPDA